MQRPLPWFWILLALLLLLGPTPAGRVLLDLVGGITLTLLVLPLLLGAAGLVAWQVLQRRLRRCNTCGFTAFGWEQCPACGSPFDPSQTGAGRPDGESRQPELDASNVTIDVEVIDEP